MIVTQLQPAKLENTSSSSFPSQIEAAIKVIGELKDVSKSVSRTLMSGIGEQYSNRSVSGRDMTDEEERVYNTCLARVQSYVMSRLDKPVGSNKNDGVEVDYSFV
jgi:hypothetical protein